VTAGPGSDTAVQGAQVNDPSPSGVVATTAARATRLAPTETIDGAARPMEGRHAPDGRGATARRRR
jgi:hypothetical protein